MQSGFVMLDTCESCNTMGTKLTANLTVRPSYSCKLLAGHLYPLRPASRCDIIRPISDNRYITASIWQSGLLWGVFTTLSHADCHYRHTATTAQARTVSSPSANKFIRRSREGVHTFHTVSQKGSPTLSIVTCNKYFHICNNNMSYTCSIK